MVLLSLRTCYKDSARDTWPNRNGCPIKHHSRTPSFVRCLAVSAAAKHPQGMTYLKDLIGGPSAGYAHLWGSDIDWGQDLLRLKTWLERHPEVGSIKLEYFNHIAPGILGISFTLPPLAEQLQL